MFGRPPSPPMWRSSSSRRRMWRSILATLPPPMHFSTRPRRCVMGLRMLVPAPPPVESALSCAGASPSHHEEEALETLRRSADLFVEFGDSKGRFMSSWEIAETLRRVGRYTEAFSELDRAEKLAVETSPNLDFLRMVFDLGMGMQGARSNPMLKTLVRWRSWAARDIAGGCGFLGGGTSRTWKTGSGPASNGGTSGGVAYACGSSRVRGRKGRSPHRRGRRMPTDESRTCCQE